MRAYEKKVLIKRYITQVEIFFVESNKSLEESLDPEIESKKVD